MKLRVDGSRITASLADEGRQETFVVDVLFRCVGGKIVPSIVFGQKPESSSASQAASDLRRVVKTIGEARVVSWSGHTFPLSRPQTPHGRDGVGRFSSFKKLGVIGRKPHGSR